MIRLLVAILIATCLPIAGCAELLDDDDDSAAQDADGDGHSVAGGDCDDSDDSIYPGADELCDDIDHNCDGDPHAGATDADTWYPDTDGDGFGADGQTVAACDQPVGHSSSADDCNDDDTAYYPGAPEEDCSDPADYNCDGLSNYEDVDGDGDAACQDCDDNNPAVHSLAVESCNAIDDDCDGLVDEAGATGESTWYLDADGDTYGRADGSQVACNAPAGFVAVSADCDDLDASSFPGATELCDGVDNDCNGLDDADNAGVDDQESDDDGDGQWECQGDCNDSDALNFLANPETCDGQDNDCDAATEAGDGESDDDSDGVINCADCDDGNATVFPGAPPVCDDVDHDCDGAVDLDADGDGFSDELCGGSDCDDADPSLFPDAAGVCAVCGDSLIEGNETCDDGGTAPGDGCSSDCLEEANSSCNGAPSVCVTDAEPDSFSFVDETYAEPNTSYDSNEVTLSGFIGDIDVTVSSSATVSIIKNGTDTGGTLSFVQEGDTVGIRMTSSTFDATVVANLTAGTLQRDWQVTTRPDEVVLGNGTRVFITDNIFNGNLGRVAGADAKCQVEADAVAKYSGGTYKAWLGAGGSYPSSTFVRSTTPYKNYEAGFGWQTIANDWTGLTTQALLHPVYYTPTDQLTDGSALSDVNQQGSAAGTPVWHNPASHVGGNCGGWTSSAGGGGMSYSHAHGVNTTRLNNWWAGVNGHSQGTICNNGCWYCGPPFASPQRLLCFEQ